MSKNSLVNRWNKWLKVKHPTEYGIPDAYYEDEANISNNKFFEAFLGIIGDSNDHEEVDIPDLIDSIFFDTLRYSMLPEKNILFLSNIDLTNLTEENIKDIKEHTNIKISNDFEEFIEYVLVNNVKKFIIN